MLKPSVRHMKGVHRSRDRWLCNSSLSKYVRKSVLQTWLTSKLRINITHIQRGMELLNRSSGIKKQITQQTHTGRNRQQRSTGREISQVLFMDGIRPVQ